MDRPSTGLSEVLGTGQTRVLGSDDFGSLLGWGQVKYFGRPKAGSVGWGQVKLQRGADVI
jgi:hypothetical protein